MRQWFQEGPLKRIITPSIHQKQILDEFTNFMKQKSGNFKYNYLLESSTNFLLGVVFRKTDQWEKLYGFDVLNRHVLAGHYDFNEKVFSEENSIKTILLLDTIHYLLTN
ncbi:MAG TPA: hypothetical protein VE573_05010 [Nitrososphaeraceae archaeon]|jgi:hypothetical protein|nr:hypothetical protein [Nitrososphaeraceae archaeon]